MGRMFRVLSDRQATGFAPVDASNVAAVPFVEVGGPEGYVTSIQAPKLVREVREYAVPQPPPLPKVHHGDYLSVKFHHPQVQQVTAPVSDVAREIVSFHHPDHMVSGEYRTVRDEISLQLNEIGSKVLYFTSTKPHAGTTTVLLNLAATFGNTTSEMKVIVVDADFDTPAGAQRLAAGEHHGLSDVLGQSVPLAWAIQPSGVPQVQVLSAGISELRPAAASDLPRLIGQLRQWFDWVLIDGGRWGQRNDRDASVNACDATYLVCRADDLERIEFNTLRQSITHHGGQLRGSITTR